MYNKNFTNYSGMHKPANLQILRNFLGNNFYNKMGRDSNQIVHREEGRGGEGRGKGGRGKGGGGEGEGGEGDG